MVGIPETSEVQGFIESVNEVSMLIDGLKAGTITPEYIDRKHADKLQRDQKQLVPVPVGSKHASLSSKAGSQPSKAEQAEQDDEAQAKKQQEEETRREQLMEKAKELQANRERKLTARHKYDQYVQTCQDQSGASTDYRKWDMWCPEDEEDDLFNSLTPNNPAFRALEKDIDERHKRMVEQRQIAERQRVAGNAAFKTCQYSEALRCYQSGLESEKTNMALHANAAQAALKINCFVQAIEHCDKVLNIADFLHNNTQTPLCAKAYMRRAMAYRSLGQFERAVADVDLALAILPGDKELMQLKAKADLDLSEHIKQKALSKALKKPAGQDASATRSTAGAGLDVDKLRRVEQLVLELREEPGQVLASADAAAAGNGVSEASAPGNVLASPGATKAAAASAPVAGASASPPGAGVSAAAAGAHCPQLPAKRRTKAQPAAGAEQADQNLCAAAQLDGLLQGDDGCCVYFRECDGIATTAQCITHAQEASSSGSSPCTPNLASYFTLLNTAAINDGNLLQLARHKALLPATLVAVTSKDVHVATAAASLLCTISTREEARILISACFAHAPSPLGGVLRSLRAASAGTHLRSLLLLLLSNCAVDATCKAGLKAALSSEVVAESLVATLKACIAVDAEAAVAERALTLIANICGSEALRAALPTHGTLAAAVAAKLQSTSNGDMHKTTPACRAAATALFNLAVDAPAQQAVATAGHLPGLLQLITTHNDTALVTLVVGAFARCIKQPLAAAEALKLQAIPKLVKLASDFTGGTEGDTAATAGALDGVVRALTLLVSNGDGIAPAEQLLDSGGGCCLRTILASPTANPATLGNAALCVANVAKHPVLVERLTALCAPARPAGVDDERTSNVPSQADAAACLVAALVRAAYMGQGTAASKNAGIALARLAAHVPLLARLKELRGLEIIHASVKSL